MITRIILALLAALSLTACATTSENAVRKTVKEHPDIVLDALGQQKADLFALVVEGQNDYQQAQRQNRQEEETRKPLAPVIDPDRAIRGKATAQVTVVVYSDFLCPYCAKGAVTLKEFMDRHPDTVRVLFKHYATDDVSRLCAMVYEALAMQDPKLAFAFHDAAFAAQKELSLAGEPAVYALAVKLGANVGKLKRDLRKPELAARIDADVAEARSFGIDGTPTFLINGVSVRGAAPLSEFEEVLRKVGTTSGEAPCATCDKKKEKK
jgi:protein-disulfide isomerase